MRQGQRRRNVERRVAGGGAVAMVADGRSGVGAGMMDAATLAIAGAAMVVAGAAKGGFGGSGAFAATPLMALALPPGQALGVMLPVLMAIDAATLWPYWRRWSLRDSAALMIAGALGVALAWPLFGMIPPDAAKLAVGLVAVVFCAFRVAQLRGWTPEGGAEWRPGRAWFWGAVAGFTSFIAHAGGPPSAMALIPRRLDKTVYQATTVVVFWWINIVKLGPYLALGLIDGTNLGMSAALAPFAAAGVVLGVIGHRRIPQNWFDIVVLTALSAAGAKLVWDGVAALSV
jgi:uncharacterized membrane protein YfcA